MGHQARRSPKEKAPIGASAESEARSISRRYLRSGAAAGAASAFGFALIHDLFISDIWNMLIIMMVAGAVCGLCIAWTFGRMLAAPSVRN